MRVSLNNKLTSICKVGRIEQLHLSQLTVDQTEWLSEYIAKDYFVFKFTHFDGCEFLQAAKTPSDIIKNIYSLYC